MVRRMVDVFAEQQRIIILQILAKDPDHKDNNIILQKGLEYVGHNVSLDKVNTECAWLEDQGMVTTEHLNGEIIIVSATRAGLDVALGRRVIPGIDPPMEGF